MDDIKISVIIPVYKVEGYLEECIDSVIGQTMENFEIICVDDASPDNSLRILQRYKENYCNLQIVRHENNKGLSAARNTGLRAAKGKYIFFLDSDDALADKRTLEELYHVAEEKQLDLLYFNYIKWYEAGKKFNGIENKNVLKAVTSGKKWFSFCCQEKRLDLVAWRQLCRRDFLLQNNIWFYEGILHEDMLFSFLCAMNAQRVMETEKTYYLYRQRENSIMKTKDKRRAQSMYVVMSEVYSYWLSLAFTEEENEAIAYYFDILYGAYKRYQTYEHEDMELECGGFAEKHTYRLMHKEAQPMFYAEQLRKVLNAENVILYGAGNIAGKVFWYLKKLGVTITGFAVSDKKGNPDELYGVKVKEIDEWNIVGENTVVVLSVGKKYLEEIKVRLMELKYCNIVTTNLEK